MIALCMITFNFKKKEEPKVVDEALNGHNSTSLQD
jgi:hypothetical protein